MFFSPSRVMVAALFFLGAIPLAAKACVVTARHHFHRRLVPRFIPLPGEL
jgi:hypothetical protein